VAVLHPIDAGVHQLEAHPDGERDGDGAKEGGGDDVEDADVFVVGRAEPAGEEPWPVIVVGVDGSPQAESKKNKFKNRY